MLLLTVQSIMSCYEKLHFFKLSVVTNRFKSTLLILLQETILCVLKAPSALIHHHFVTQIFRQHHHIHLFLTALSHHLAWLTLFRHTSRYSQLSVITYRCCQVLSVTDLRCYSHLLAATLHKLHLSAKDHDVTCFSQHCLLFTVNSTHELLSW